MTEPNHLVIDGISSLEIERGDLVIKCGIPRGSRTLRLERTERTIRTVIVPSRHGYISLDAFQWVHDVGMTLYVINDGKLNFHASGIYRDAHLRRAQAAAIGNQTGIDITHYLLAHKLAGQRDILADLDPSRLTEFDAVAGLLSETGDIDTCRNLEGKAGEIYWSVWKPLKVNWSTSRIKPRWCEFGTRTSPLSASPRSAVNPVNAVLNYAYAVLEGEATTACFALGLDPLLGIFHFDQAKRASMPMDLMEVARPLVDLEVLRWIEERTFNQKEFYESPSGVTRLVAPIHKHVTAMVMETIPSIYHHWEHVAHRLAEDTHGQYGNRRSNRRTPLTQNNRKGRGTRIRKMP